MMNDTTENVEEKPAEQPVLGLNDLALSVNLINVAIKRGAFERTELRSVLDVTDKIEAFLAIHAAEQKAAQEEQGVEAQAEEGES